MTIKGLNDKAAQELDKIQEMGWLIESIKIDGEFISCKIIRQTNEL